MLQNTLIARVEEFIEDIPWTLLDDKLRINDVQYIVKEFKDKMHKDCTLVIREQIVPMKQ